jgi:hypothetical protein
MRLKRIKYKRTNVDPKKRPQGPLSVIKLRRPTDLAPIIRAAKGCDPE